MFVFHQLSSNFRPDDVIEGMHIHMIHMRIREGQWYLFQMSYFLIFYPELEKRFFCTNMREKSTFLHRKQKKKFHLVSCVI